MGMDISVRWTGDFAWQGEFEPDEWNPEIPAAAGQRESYGRSGPCEFCPLIREVLDGTAPDKFTDPRGYPANGSIPAAVLRYRLPAAQARARARCGWYGEEQAANIAEFVRLIERLEAGGHKPTIWAFT